MIIGRQLVEDQYEEKLYSSTGDDYLDELLEKAFCEGYEYAQKEFNSKTRKAELRKEAVKKAWESNEATGMALYNYANNPRKYATLDDALVKSHRLSKKGNLQKALNNPKTQKFLNKVAPMK